MGLLGNVAEVEYLRIHLMQERYVTVFANLLRSNSDGIEVSYFPFSFSIFYLLQIIYFYFIRAFFTIQIFNVLTNIFLNIIGPI